jgi:N-acyl homoserine lactone hydrolase
MSTWTITPLVVALGPQREKSRFTYMHNFGDKVDVPYVAWLLRDGEHTVLVDTGCSAQAFAEQIRPGDGPLMLAGERFQDVQDIVPIEERLAAQGLGFDDIDLLIQTHLDWDHTMNTTKFTRSRIVVQRDEWTKIPAHPLFASTYAPKSHYEAIGNLNLDLLEGDQEMFPGLRLMVTAGHSPAGQSIVVDTDEGPHVIVGMCTIRENFFPPESVLSKGTYTVIPTGMHTDLLRCYDSMLRIKAVPEATILPFRDDAVLTMEPIG